MDNLRSQVLESTKKPPPARAEGLLDVNVLPERYRPRRINWRTALAWLIFAAVLTLLVPSYDRFQLASEALALQQAELTLLRRSMIEAQTEPEQLQSLRDRIENANLRLLALTESLDRFNVQLVAWGDLLSQVRALAPEGVAVLKLDQQQDTIRVVGQADTYAAPLAYVDELSQLPDFSSVRLASIVRIDDDGSQIVAEAEEESETGNLQTASYTFALDLNVPVTFDFENDAPEADE